MITLTIVNADGLAHSYVGGLVTLPPIVNSTFVVPNTLNYELITDTLFRRDLLDDKVRLNDGATDYGTVDALLFLDSQTRGLRDGDGYGITSTEITTFDSVVH